jgi:hypothetical protein
MKKAPKNHLQIPQISYMPIRAFFRRFTFQCPDAMDFSTSRMIDRSEL